MRLSTRGRYSVMAIVDLARNHQGSPVALAEVAARQEISLSYLEQLFGQLRRAGIVRGVRGPGGGYMMNISPENCRISDIVRAVDEPLKATRCQPGSPEGCRSDKSRCATHDLWNELGNQIALFLSSVTVTDVIDGTIVERRTSPFGPGASLDSVSSSTGSDGGIFS